MAPDDDLREWGQWTELKLCILQRYLTEFTTASKRMSALVFLDAFAGQGLGRSRDMALVVGFDVSWSRPSGDRER